MLLERCVLLEPAVSLEWSISSTRVNASALTVSIVFELYNTLFFNVEFAVLDRQGQIHVARRAREAVAVLLLAERAHVFVVRRLVVERSRRPFFGPSDEPPIPHAFDVFL